MTLRPNRMRARAATAFAAALLAGSALGGGLVAWAEAGASAAPLSAVSPPPAVSAMPEQAGFAPLVAKVKPAVVNIATTAKAKAEQMPELPDFAPGSPFADMFRQFFQHQTARSHVNHAQFGHNRVHHAMPRQR